jgi:hypothetical protein
MKVASIRWFDLDDHRPRANDSFAQGHFSQENEHIQESSCCQMPKEGFSVSRENFASRPDARAPSE